jgi:hypothetical protein
MEMGRGCMELYGELSCIAGEIKPYYDIDKVKSYSVYVWTKGNPNADNEDDKYGRNVFDICEDELIFYVEDHVVIEEAKPIIEKIQAKLREIANSTEQ